MKNILYIENSFGNSYGYYHEILNGFAQALGSDGGRVYVFNNFSPESKEDNVYNLDLVIASLKKHNLDVDAVVFGFGWTNTGPYPPNSFILSDENIKRYVILNKEYSALEEKLDWIKSNNFECAFTVHHDFKKYEEVTGIPFYHLPFAANPQLFKNYNESLEFEYDFGFTGIVRKEQTENWRSRVHETLENADIWGDTKIYFTDHHHDSLEDYAKRICTSKIWFSTTGPADLVGTRYYEVMLTGTTLLACNRFDYLGLFEEDKHCIMFDSVEELAEKVKYFSNPANEEERMQIVKSAQNLALEKHTWASRGITMIERINDKN